MKERFSTVDLVAVVEYFNRKLLGMRAANIYDIDHKTYLIKLARSEEKAMLLFESGCRIHTTEFDWPKNMMPSGFAMKLRKHLRTKRLISVTQLGIDRVVDLQFGSAEHAHHLIIELYDKGNVILTDHSYTILSLLRVRTDNDTEVRFAIREKFSIETVKMDQPTPTKEQVSKILSSAKPGDQLKHVLNPHFVFGPALLSHCIVGVGLSENAKFGTDIDQCKVSDIELVLSIISECFTLFNAFHSQPCKGYLIQKKETSPLSRLDNGSDLSTQDRQEELVTNVEFHPMLFRQHSSAVYQETDTFNKAVDLFFSSKTSQKQDIKVHQMQKTAVKKLDNIRHDHERRLLALQHSQDEDIYKASLIIDNTYIVEKACLVIRSAVASSMDWGDIDLFVREAQSRGDPVASCIHGLKLESNQITLLLKQPFDNEEEEEEESKPQKKRKLAKKGVKVDIDLSISAYANAQKYYTLKKSAAKKEQKTVDSSKKAFKSAEKKAKQSMKEAAVVSRIQKARKVLWFEKFFWFISSENYLVIGGRDQQQNELIVKKYLNNSDLYVHADLHGATSVVIKNPKGGPVPPKTLNESGMMAVCYSSAWEAKIVTSAWWVYANQVSKTAPSGEYLTTGSFMIRGKKNFLPPCQLTLGFSVMFKLDETCIALHLNERRVKGVDDDLSSMASEVMSELTIDEEEIQEEIMDDTTVDQSKEQLAIEENDVSREEGTSDDEKDEEDDDEEDGNGLFDTAIQIQSRGVIKLEVQRSTSNVSSVTEVNNFEQQKESTEEQDSVSSRVSHKHLSAKERRMLKKKGHDYSSEQRSEQRSEQEEEKRDKVSKKAKKNDDKEKQLPSSNQYKRGQKSKQKKIKDRYWDQDEEEKLMKMEILASSGTPKEIIVGKKNKKKDKRGDLGQSFNPKAKYHQKSKEKTQAVFVGKQHKQQGPTIIEVINENDEEEMMQPLKDMMELLIENEKIESGSEDIENEDIKDEDKIRNEDIETENDVKDDGIPSPSIPMVPLLSNGPELTSDHLIHDQSTRESHANHHDDEESDDEEKKAILAEENIVQLQESEKNSLVIDSLTGSPFPNDLLLFAIPVCAPYSALHDYKFKVKLVPGTNRRGKAAKTAVYKFIQMKETHQLEKDLLRSIKDNDLSRYFPGKVKMTIPQQILRTKHK